MKKFLAGILIIILFSTSSLLSEGYLCFQNLQALKLCKCNHSSEKELHSNTNDVLLPEHTTTFKSNEGLPKCHDSSRISSPHICSCKKSEATLEAFLLQKSTLSIVVAAQIPYYIQTVLSFNREITYILPSGFQYIITPPPKFI
jgi:hypothetical protein